MPAGRGDSGRRRRRLCPQAATRRSRDCHRSQHRTVGGPEHPDRGRQHRQPDNVDAVDNFVAEDFVLTTGGRDIVGRDAFKQWIRYFSAQIADLKFEIVNTFQSADGRLVSARFRICGLNNGLMGFPADQRRIEFTGNAIWLVGAGGRLVRNWVERSAFELFRDLKGMSDLDDPFAVARK
jgi:predicted ester cyclase